MTDEPIKKNYNEKLKMYKEYKDREIDILGHIIEFLECSKIDFNIYPDGHITFSMDIEHEKIYGELSVEEYFQAPLRIILKLTGLKDPYITFCVGLNITKVNFDSPRLNPFSKLMEHLALNMKVATAKVSYVP